ncbi:Uncharacterised protein [Acinetobacter baumannii]|nr:Uncharacterised protein [Acinetobacter baumannii]
MPGLPRSHAQSNSPVLASNALMTPEGSPFITLSITQPPTIIFPLAMVGAEVWK